MVRENVHLYSMCPAALCSDIILTRSLKTRPPHTSPLLLLLLLLRRRAGYHAKTNGREVADALAANIAGKTFLVTGGTGGLGLETVLMLAERGAARVWFTGRSQATIDAATAKLQARVPGGLSNLRGLVCNLGSLASVAAAADTFLASGEPLHVLINNAGVMACPKTLTADGFEEQFGVNHIGHFHLTNLLLPKLKETAAALRGGAPAPAPGTPCPVRVVNLASVAHYAFAPRPSGIYWDDLAAVKGYNAWGRYGQAKLANILHAQELQRRLDAEGAGVTFVPIHPGVIMETDLMRHMSFRFVADMLSHPRMVMTMGGSKTTQQGISTTLVAALHPDVVPGAYYSDCNVETKQVHPIVGSAEAGARLWRASEELVAGAVAKAASGGAAAQ